MFAFFESKQLVKRFLLRFFQHFHPRCQLAGGEIHDVGMVIGAEHRIVGRRFQPLGLFGKAEMETNLPAARGCLL